MASDSDFFLYSSDLAKALDSNDSCAANEILDKCWQNIIDMDQRKQLIIEVDRLDQKGVGLDVVLKLDERNQLIGFDIA